MEQEFFKTFKIPPMIKKGQTYLNTDCRVAEYVAEKDKYISISPNIIIDLENMLLNRDDHCYIELHVAHVEEGDDLDLPVGTSIYQYIVGESDNEGYHHGFSNNVSLSRKDALMSYLIHYSYVDTIYDGVRKVFSFYQNMEE